MIIGRGLLVKPPTIGGRRVQLAGARQIEEERPKARNDAEARAQAMAEALSGAFRPTAAPGVLTGAGRVAEVLSQYYGQRSEHNQEQAERDREQWDTNREQKQEAGQRTAISEALAGFDPNNPRGLVEGLRQQAPEQALDLAGALAGREPQEQWSEPFDQGGVQVQRSSTTNQIRPIGNPPAAAIYQAPAGYRGSPEAGLEPIPGGPADVRASAEGRSRLQQLDSSARQLENAIGVLQQAEGQVNGWNTGMVGQASRGMGGTPGYDLNQALEPVRAILSFENLAEMRRNSATGGALGSIAVRELELLSNTVRSLDTAQSEDQLRANLRDVRERLTRTFQAVQAARQEMDNGPDAAPQEPNMAGEQEQPRVMQWTPERGVH